MGTVLNCIPSRSGCFPFTLFRGKDKMTKLSFSIDGNTIKFSKGPPVTPSDPPPMGKNELIAFIRWLKANCRDEDLPPDVRKIGLFNRREHDFREDRIAKLKVIREREPEIAYGELVRRKNAIPFSRRLRESCGLTIWYREDLYDFLIEKGFSEKDAARFTRLIAAGAYKTYCRENPRKKTLEPILPDLHVLGKCVRYLPERIGLARWFSEQYERFKADETTNENN